MKVTFYSNDNLTLKKGKMHEVEINIRAVFDKNEY